MVLSKIQHEKIDPKNPWLRDKLGRKKVADYLTPVLASIRQPFVLSLHSPYGTGKSFFLECWRADLEAQGYKVVLFDAWKTDFSHDPLSAFISALKKQTESDSEAARERWVALAKQTAGILRSKAVPLLVKGALRKFLGEEGMGELQAAFHLDGNEVAEALGSAAVEALNAQEAAECSMSEFRELLRKAAKDLVASNSDENTKKLIVLVDELDRCKPSYAIDVLECIKHFFAVEGTVFVLAFDEDQMLEAISQTYGLKNSGEGYLRKFIDWRFELPKPQVGQYCDYLQENLFSNDVAHIGSDIANGIQSAAMTKSMSLRQVEQSFSYANLVMRSSDGGVVKYFPYAFGVMAGLFSWCQSYLKDLVIDLPKAIIFVDEVAEAFQNDPNLPQGRIFIDKRFLAYFLSEDLVRNVQIYSSETEPKAMKLSAAELALYELGPQEAYSAFDHLSQSLYLGFESGSVARLCYSLLSGASRILR